MATLLTSGTIGSFTLSALLFIIASYCVAYYFIYLRQTKRWKQSNIPFLQPVFLIGHKDFLILSKRCITVFIEKIYNENRDKDVIAFFAGTMPMIMIKDIKLIRQVCIKNANLSFATGVNMPESEVEAQFMVNFTVNEERWKFVRDVMTPAFLLSWFQGPRFGRIKETINDMLQSAEKTQAEGSPFLINEATKNAILNVGSSNFGVENQPAAMKDGLRSIIDDFFETSYRKQLNFHTLTYLPSLQKFEWFRVLSRRSINVMSEMLQHTIKQRDEMNVENECCDLIDILRSYRTKEDSNDSWNNDSSSLSFSEGITLRQMTGISFGITIGGTEAVYRLLDFTVHALSLNPECQRKITKEVLEALEKHGVSEFNFEVVRSLSFTTQCLLEASRLYPLGPFLMRQCLEDFQIPGTKYIFRKGDRIIIPWYSLHRDEEHFRDPLSFYPERFNSKETNFVIPPTLWSFGTGPRKCPGYKHGLFVASAILGSLVYNYEIKPRSHQKLMEATDFHLKGFTTIPKKEILVDLVRRENLNHAQNRD